MTFLAATGRQMVLAEDLQKGHKVIPATQTSVLVPPGSCWHSQAAKKNLTALKLFLSFSSHKICGYNAKTKNLASFSPIY